MKNRGYKEKAQKKLCEALGLDDIALLEQHREQIFEVLDTLYPRECRILKLRCSLGDGQGHTQEEIGKMFGLHRNRIFQIEAKALRKLRHPLRRRLLKDLLEVEE